MIARLIKRIVVSQQGQALPIVLALLMLGGLTITPALNHTVTGIKSSQNIEKSVSGLYAAEAGIEQTLWNIKNSLPPPTSLAENVNQMSVSIQTQNRGAFTLYFGELVPVSGHSEWLDVDGSIEWDAGFGAYKYTITVTWQPIPGTPKIHLSEVGVTLPLGYTYRADSAELFPENLSTSNPDPSGQDPSGAYMYKWRFSSPYPAVEQHDPIKREIFYFDGSGDLEGDYTWTVAVRTDVGIVGELTGALNIITSTATSSPGGQVTGTIMAEILEADKTYIVAWRIIK